MTNKKHEDKKITLAPLSFEEALRGLLEVAPSPQDDRPEPERERPKRPRKRKPTDKEERPPK